MNHKPGELSGGERQRVAVARALANDPPIIIADEPTGNLDSKTGESIMEMLQNLQKKFKKTLIVITHDLEVAKKAQKIYKLRDGVIIQCSKGRNC